MTNQPTSNPSRICGFCGRRYVVGEGHDCSHIPPAPTTPSPQSAAEPFEQTVTDQFVKYSKRVRQTETGSLNWVDEKAAILAAHEAAVREFADKVKARLRVSYVYTTDDAIADIDAEIARLGQGEGEKGG